ncbi:putative glycosyl hydrolase [Diplogelasinospora grovesii]|uniref:Glycosyl hydrolase n=1 Tax=Diplogelasinospora grovesii TaxID=303347 RepID=A0AAN6N869_9PEZI|nr:putative glycosyl hydrolase [Diplogelasinospora grovesii]
MMMASLQPLLLLALAAANTLAAPPSRQSTPRAYGSNTPPSITPETRQNEANYTAPYFPLLGFEQYAGNPILRPNPNNSWESAYLYNPSAIVLDDKVFLLYRAQDQEKKSSIGLAWSDDGYSFTRYNKPVVEATEWYEEIGGCEDPRVVRVNGTFYLTYTAYNNVTARLCLATSTDLVHWTKYGPILPDFTEIVYNWRQPVVYYGPTPAGWTKSGAIIDERQPDGYYYMQFGDTYLYTANSTDLIHWSVSGGAAGVPFAPPLNVWEQGLMESGPPPIKTRDGKWLKVYNAMATGLGGYTATQYSTGQMLIDPANAPLGPPLARIETPILQPTTQTEIKGQVDNVVFSEGLVQFRGKWLLYFGAGDAFLSVAQAPVQP